MRYPTDSGGATYLIYWLGEVTRMSEPGNNRKRNREELKAKRNLLFKLFLKNPVHTRLAIEIKVIDDQLAERTQQMERK